MKLSKKTINELKLVSGKKMWFYLQTNYHDIWRYLQLKGKARQINLPKLHSLMYGKKLCIGCGKPTKYINFKKGFQTFCSVTCSNKSAIAQGNREKTMIEKYGAKNAGNVKSIVEKRKATMVERYGVEYSGQSKKLLRKAQKTILARYGVDNVMKSKKILKKMRKANLKKYGVDNVFKLIENQDKRKATMIKRYGVEHNLQDRELFEKQQKAGFSTRAVKFKGKTFKVRGYEDIALNYMVDTLKIAPRDIKNTAKEGVKAIAYTYKGKDHYYHPDFKIKLKNKNYLVEVKSDYTLGLIKNKNLFYLTKAKAKTCVNNGHRFLLIIVTKKHKVYVVKDFVDKKRKELINLVT